MLLICGIRLATYFSAISFPFASRRAFKRGFLSAFGTDLGFGNALFTALLRTTNAAWSPPRWSEPVGLSSFVSEGIVELELKRFFFFPARI